MSAVGGQTVVALLDRARVSLDPSDPAEDSVRRLLVSMSWRSRRASLDRGRAGRVRLLLFRDGETQLGIECLVEALVERCTVFYWCPEDGASRARLVALQRVLVDAGLPHAQLQVGTFSLERAEARDVIAARRTRVDLVGDPSLTTLLAPSVDVRLPRSRQLASAASREGQLQWLKDTVRHAASIEFYRRRFANAGLHDGELTSWEQFVTLPLTERDDLLRHGPPTSDALLAGPFSSLKSASVFATGGSTGAPKFAIYGTDEYDEVTDIGAEQLLLHGIGPGDRVGNVFFPGKLWSAFIAIDITLRKIGCMSFPFGDMDPAEVLARCREFGVTTLIGIPSVLMRLAHAAEASSAMRPRIDKLIFAGEHLTEGMANYLQEVFGSDVIASVAYSAIDAGVIGFQPARGERGIYHALDNHAVVEICDATTGRPVAIGEEGEVVVTNHARRLFPVVRLRTGDLACQLASGRFQLRGRNDDKIRIGGENLFLSDVEGLCEAFAEDLSPLYQVQLSKVGGDDCFRVAIETRRPLEETVRASLAVRVRERYFRRAPDLAHAVEAGLLRHFHLDLLAPGALPQNARTGKIRRVIDKRLDEPTAPRQSGDVPSDVDPGKS